jgi:hypothetical protein
MPSRGGLRLRGHLAAHHPHRGRRLSWSERLTWSCWFVFQSKEDYGDPIIGARRREMLTVFYDTLLVLADDRVTRDLGGTRGAGSVA